MMPIAPVAPLRVTQRVSGDPEVLSGRGGAGVRWPRDVSSLGLPTFRLLPTLAISRERRDRSASPYE
jgi:hypothetical protein